MSLGDGHVGSNYTTKTGKCGTLRFYPLEASCELIINMLLPAGAVMGGAGIVSRSPHSKTCLLPTPRNAWTQSHFIAHGRSCSSSDPGVCGCSHRTPSFLEDSAVRALRRHEGLCCILTTGGQCCHSQRTNTTRRAPAELSASALRPWLLSPWGPPLEAQEKRVGRGLKPQCS